MPPSAAPRWRSGVRGGQAFPAEVGLRRLRPLGRAVRTDGSAWRAGDGQQRANGALRALVLALPEVDVPHVAGAVDQIVGRPVLVRVRVPGPEVVVERHRMLDAEVLHGSAHVARLVLEGELRARGRRRRQAIAPVRVVPRLHVRQLAQAVDARVGPEVHEHDLSAKARQGQRATARRVEPQGHVLEVRRRPVIVQRRRRPRTRPAACFTKPGECALCSCARLDVLLHRPACSRERPL